MLQDFFRCRIVEIVAGFFLLQDCVAGLCKMLQDCGD